MSPRNIALGRARRGRAAPRKRPRAKEASRGSSTREHLLETAGQVFSEKGFAAATGKEICKRCGSNAAAVVYHFGGMENLYRAAVEEARRRVAPPGALATAVAGETDPEAKLHAFIGLLVRILSGPVSSTWAARLVSREVVAPTDIFEEMRSQEMLDRASILGSIVSELTGLPRNHPALARSCINIMAPIAVLLLIGPTRVANNIPTLSLDPKSADELTRHMVQFALGGLAAVARATS